MIGEKIRKYGFWILDFLKKGEVRKHYTDIKLILDEDYNHNKKIEGYKNRILKYAVDNTDFYRKYKNFKSIRDFPIIDKNLIKFNENKIISKSYFKKQLHTMSTSGSTGTPFTLKQDQNKRNRVLAEIIYFGEICGYNIGDRNVFLRTWTKKNKKSLWYAYKQNLVMLDISNLNKESLEEIRTILKKDKKIKCILGYASSLDKISNYMLEKNDNPDMFNIDIIISGAEVLNENTRQNLKRLFGCNVVSRYSNQENGILAQELLNNNFFKLNNASYLIEFLKIDSNLEADYGELSRIVITDLFNFAMPIIRYDTGDLAIVKNDPRHGEIITSIEGRKRDFIYDANDNVLSPSVITANLSDFPLIKQFQFIQEDKANYILKLNGEQGIYKDGEFISLFKDILGDDIKITIEHVENIPTLGSGKFQQVVCNYVPSGN